jgi:hypothetical protein
MKEYGNKLHSKNKKTTLRPRLGIERNVKSEKALLPILPIPRSEDGKLKGKSTNINILYRVGGTCRVTDYAT